MNDITAERILADGRWAFVLPLLYGRGRLCVSSPASGCIDDVW